MCASERSERALKSYIFLILYPIYYAQYIYLTHDRNLWGGGGGGLFVGPLRGQLPTLPSPKSGTEDTLVSAA